MKFRNGFSLIELLIVVAIIGIMAAIAIPNMLASRRIANEANACSRLRTVFSAEATYQATAGQGKYGYQSDLVVVGLLDNVERPYIFAAMPVLGGKYFDAITMPRRTTGIGRDGDASYFTNETGVMFVGNGTRPPTCDLTNRLMVYDGRVLN